MSGQSSPRPSAHCFAHRARAVRVHALASRRLVRSGDAWAFACRAHNPLPVRLNSTPAPLGSNQPLPVQSVHCRSDQCLSCPAPEEALEISALPPRSFVSQTLPLRHEASPLLVIANPAVLFHCTQVDAAPVPCYLLSFHVQPVPIKPMPVPSRLSRSEQRPGHSSQSFAVAVPSHTLASQL